MKTSSIITDEHVQNILRCALREMKDDHRTPEAFKTILTEKLFKEIPNAPKKLVPGTVNDG